MAYVVEFEWREDQELGGEGWGLIANPDFNVSFGLGLVHDVLEHFPGMYHGIEHECLAFGSMLYMRVEGGWFWQRGGMFTPAQNMAHDLHRFLVEEHELRIKPCKVRRLDPESEPEYVLRDLEEEMRKLWNSEGYYGETPPWSLAKRDEAYASMFAWIRTGYRKAVRRWRSPGRRHQPEELAHLFGEMVKELESPRYQRGEYYERLKVSVNINELSFRAYRYFPSDYYD